MFFRLVCEHKYKMWKIFNFNLSRRTHHRMSIIGKFFCNTTKTQGVQQRLVVAAVRECMSLLVRSRVNVGTSCFGVFVNVERKAKLKC